MRLYERSSVPTHLGESFPDKNRPVLEVFVIPEQGFMGPRIGMPIDVLTSRNSVKIDDRVDAMPSALQ